jgi:hypothetical protein
MPNTAKFTTSRSIVSLADRTTRQTNEHRTRRILFDRAGGGVHGVRALGPVARLAALVGGLVGFRARARHPLRAGLPPHTASTILGAQRTPWERDMDTTTLLIIILIVLLVGGGGFYGRGRWW